MKIRIHGPFTTTTVLILVVCGIGSGWRGFQLHEESGRQSCIINMRFIASAKGSVGLENNLAKGQPVSLERLFPYFKDGGKWMTCPARGTYAPGLFTGGKDMGDVSYAPTCTVHGSLADNDYYDTARQPNPYIALSIISFVITAVLTLGYFVTNGNFTKRPQLRQF